MMTLTRRVGLVWILAFIALMLLGCDSSVPNLAQSSPLAGNPTSIPIIDPPSAMAQATLDAGQNQLAELHRKETEISLDMASAENASVLATQEFNQRRQMELDYQATIISQEMAAAAVTQEFVAQQTRIARDATAVIEENAARATQSANFMMATQAVQARAILDARVQQTALAVAALTAYPMTTTPLAQTQAALLSQQYDRERRAFEDQVVAPLIPFMIFLVVLLLILGVILVYRRMIPPNRIYRARLLPSIDAPSALPLVDAVVVNPDARNFPRSNDELPAPGLPEPAGELRMRVEIVEASEPPFSHWISDLAYQLTAEGKDPA